jgi:hypothetical protein
MVFQYKPSTPKLSLVKIDILELKLCGNILNSTIEINLLSKNPNKNFSINYDEFHIYAICNNQNITNESIVPPFNQVEGTTEMMYTTLNGNGLIIAPSISNDLSQAQTYGSLRLTILANAKLRWKVADWMSGPYNIQVTCDSTIYFQNGSPVEDPNLTTLQECKTYV